MDRSEKKPLLPLDRGGFTFEIHPNCSIFKRTRINPTVFYGIPFRGTQRLVEFLIPIEGAMILAITPRVTEVGMLLGRYEKTGQGKGYILPSPGQKRLVRHIPNFPLCKVKPGHPFMTTILPCCPAKIMSTIS